MVDLVARAAWDGIELPLTIGGTVLAALPQTSRLSIAPFRGQSAAVEQALGVPLPGRGTAADLAAGGRIFWAGLDQWFLEGAPAPALAGRAALTDQSDAWTGLGLRGPGAAEVLARVVPIDLHPAAFPPGRAARTELRHMMCVLLAVAGGFDLLVMRSFTATSVHELTTAMRAVAARHALG